MTRGSVQDALGLLAADPALRTLLANLSTETILSTARRWASEDPHGIARITVEALQRIQPEAPVDPAAVVDHLRHLLWCHARDASPERGPPDAPLELVGREWLEQTRGHPTVLLTPMTAAQTDALTVLERVLAGRPWFVYGEGVDFDPDHGAGEPLAAMLGALETLDAGGVYCTYPDFVYADHPSVDVELFGVARPMASAFAALCARPGVQLLPAVLLAEPDRLVVELFEPIVLELRLGGRRKAEALPAVASLVARALERCIRRAPARWLLLGTLAAEVERQSPLSATSGTD